MKLLKIVLIALVTVCIYSFTNIKNKKEIPVKNKIEYYDGCVTLVYKEVTRESEKDPIRNYALNLVREQGIQIGPLFEKGINFERYFYTIIHPTVISGNTNSSDLEDEEDEYQKYVTINIGSCTSRVPDVIKAI